MEQTGTVTVTGGCCGASDNRMYQRRDRREAMDYRN